MSRNKADVKKRKPPTEPYLLTQAEFQKATWTESRETIRRAHVYAREEVERMAATDEQRRISRGRSIDHDNAMHRACVVWALRHGKKIRRGIIEDYPDLLPYWRTGIKPFRTSPPPGTPERANWEAFPAVVLEQIEKYRGIQQGGISAFMSMGSLGGAFASETAKQRLEALHRRLSHIRGELARAEEEDIQEAVLFGRQADFALGADEGNATAPFRHESNSYWATENRRRERRYQEILDRAGRKF